MRVKLSDYIAGFLVQNEISHVFTVTGGGAMHLNDSFGHHPNLQCIYNHHEQACSIAAEAYARIDNKIAAVCVTSGPGGTNAITGVVGGWLDSIPMLVISGQVKRETTVWSTNLPLRQLGDQEFNIVDAVSCMTKYAAMVTDENEIAYHLEKALFLAKSGRPGPCWLDIPLDVQGAIIETDELKHFDELNTITDYNISENELNLVLEKLESAQRPIIYAGNGIRLSGAFNVFRKIIEKLNIPIVTGWNSIDIIHDAHKLYVGRGGIMGDRAGNFAVQNSDLILSLGSRLSIRQVGYNYQTWARNAFKIVVDIDNAELCKPTLKIDMPICTDVKHFLSRLDNKLDDKSLQINKLWLEKCTHWKQNYPVVQKKHYDDINNTNVYCFVKELSSSLPENMITVVGNGSACVVGSHGYVIKEGQRFIINSAVAAMGYDLPAAIGVCIANKNKEIVCLTGDGSIQMNLQELQTIIHLKLPIKIVIINNNGYHSIRQTQKSFFNDPLVGIGYDSGDLSFPNFEKLSYAYGFPYFVCKKNENIKEVLSNLFAIDGPALCEIIVSTNQLFEPKSATKQLEDGTFISPPLEDMFPFLSKEELAENMLI